ncbi:MAG: Elongation factor 4 [Microgenomates group bacterium GW2011_GWF2_47_9]|nr:MAG: Elongation factor 4 [Microgenomates group bacterium GW2011_GWF2_47_9]
MKNIRNFSIIAHIDHGKTTLTDRILEFTGTVKASHATRIMDSNPIEQERGITIKLAPVRLDYKGYILNLIDTPGHVDFAYEVSRSLKACDGAVLVVDATKGIQAQTLANYDKAVEHNLHIIPVINKIDLDSAEPEKTADELVSILGFKKEDILYVSAKTGVGVEGLLDAITAKVPPPRISPSKDNELKALVFNSTFDIHKGVIAFVEVVQGQINSQNLDRLVLYQAQEPMNPLEIGFFTPLMTASSILNTGEVGYIATGHKDIRDVTIGDTVTTKGSLITPIEGYERPLPMVFMDLYPGDAGDFRLLATALEKLALNDASLTFTITASPALGHGFRVGFLGILHAEIVSERLFQEFGVSCVNTTPSVPYRLTLSNNEHSEISSPADYPTPESIKEVQEPFILLTIYTPESYVGAVMELAQTKRAEFIDMQYPAPGKAKLEYLMPLAELITNFYDRLKSVSSGYASVEYEHAGYQPVDAVKVDILLNSEPASALSFICPRIQAEGKGRALVEKLKVVIPRSQIEVAIQASIGGKIIARSTVKAYRKDVTAKLHGGDMTRNRKLLEKQKKGKKKMKMLGNVAVPTSAFTEILKIT